MSFDALVALKVKDVMSRRVVTMAENSSIMDAVQKMNAVNIGAVVIEHGGEIRGIFSERDVVRVLAEGKDLAAIPISRVMTKAPKVLNPETSFLKALELMQSGNFRHIPIVADDVLVGIISIKDIDMEILKKANEKLKIDTAQFIQEQKVNTTKDVTLDIAHKLKQPLHITKLICQSILRDIQKGRFNKEEAEKDLPEIINQMNNMADLLDHAMVSIQGGKNTPPGNA